MNVNTRNSNKSDPYILYWLERPPTRNATRCCIGKWANSVMNIKKVKDFSKSKPYVVVSETKGNNPLLAGSFVNTTGDYVATFDISRVCPKFFEDEDNIDLEGAFNTFKKLVKENKDKFVCLDFSISELSGGACSRVLIVSTGREMSVRRVLSLLPRNETFTSVKANFDTAVLKGRYKYVTPELSNNNEVETDDGEEV
ncbi:hypothetical protein [uncultured phage cr61_1]|uniref:Uncharacterized protein n=1 Tax=uncultured phage cr61_1 TaxID=2986417 RepID=A0AAE7S2K0_9CAUD|nr:hypothetical protein OJM08_gp67 [uncultured phage cr61_1]QWM90575.1 hypothetical protein [uncultured phage cr61_1]